MENKTIFGHKKVRAQLAEEYGQGNVAHAYLFFGPAGVGKHSVAVEFASRILNQSHSDFFELDLAGENNENSIEKLREFLSIISVRPVAGNYKVAVINNFDLASSAMENAMLKTLEEPSQSTVLILVSSRQHLPTIISRSRVIPFNRLSDGELKEFAEHNQIEINDDVLSLSAGSPGRLVNLSKDTASAKTILAWAKKLAALNNAPSSDKLLAVAELGSEETATLREVLLAFLEHQRARLSEHPELVPSIRKTVEALDLLRFNLNKKLVLQKLLL